MENIINGLFTNCEAKKYHSKSNHLDFSEETSIETFNIFLSPTLQYYLENNPNDPYDINQLREFMDILLTSVIKQTSEYVNNTGNKRDTNDYLL